MRLRQGDIAVLDEYDQDGCIRGAPPEAAVDQAVHAYVASYLEGRDVLLMAADWARCRELSARIRDDLIHLGLVDNRRTIRIAKGAEASAGDLIICRRNDYQIEAGEPGRALANGDVLRIEAITRHGIMVHRLLGPDPVTGQRRFTSQAFGYTGYSSSDLAYAITGHSEQGATVHTGIALVIGTEEHQWLYPAMTSGTDANLAFVFTTPARPRHPPRRGLSLTGLARAIGARAESVLIPWDCADGFYEACWRRPAAYLDVQVRRGMSIWARVGPDAEQRAVRSLGEELASGRWAERNRGLAGLDAAELGERLLIA